MKNTLYSILFFLIGFPVFGMDFPDFKSGDYVIDTANVFLVSDLEKLNKESEKFKEKTGVHFISVYLDSTKGEKVCEVTTQVLNLAKSQLPENASIFVFSYSLEENFACYQSTLMISYFITSIIGDRLYYKAFFPLQGNGQNAEAYIAVQNVLLGTIVLETKEFQSNAFSIALPFLNEEVERIHSDIMQNVSDDELVALSLFVAGLLLFLGLIFLKFRGVFSWFLFLFLSPFLLLLSFLSAKGFGMGAFLVYFVSLFVLRILFSLLASVGDLVSKLPKSTIPKNPTSTAKEVLATKRVKEAPLPPNPINDELRSNFYTEEENNERFG